MADDGYSQDAFFNGGGWDQNSTLSPQAQYQQMLTNFQGMGSMNSTQQAQTQANGFAPGQSFDAMSGSFVSPPSLGSYGMGGAPIGMMTNPNGYQPGPPISNSGMDLALAGVGGPPAGTIVGQSNPAQAQYQQLLQQLISQAQSSSADRTKQYGDLQKSILGSKGYLGSVGKVGQQQINMNEKNQLGGLQQNLVNRGLGNSTIQNSLSGGISRNAQMERDNLSSAVGGQKTNAAMGLFNMNPAPSTDTYLNLLTRLGSVAGR